MSNYKLNLEKTEEKKLMLQLSKLSPLFRSEKKNFASASIATFFNSILNLVSPLLIGYGIDHFIANKDMGGVYAISLLLFSIYLAMLFTYYIQTKTMGSVGQRVLYNLRNSIFKKLEELPISFFNQNKAGDLISRINNDTDKLNQFLSQSFGQFLSSTLLMTGTVVFVLSINFKLGLVALTPALLLFSYTRALSLWVRRKNKLSLKAAGEMSGHIQESLDNFKVIVAFNRRDYFKSRFEEANIKNYRSAIISGNASNIFIPVYGLATHFAQLSVLIYGIHLISVGQITLGLFISFLFYINNFYQPLRQMAALWSSLQVALASWERINDILNLETDLQIMPSEIKQANSHLLEFDHVNFSYDENVKVLDDICLTMEKGKTYALVGPTGGGKTTTASLIARLYDPIEGNIFLKGRNLRSIPAEERARQIGFILQEPFLFNGTVGENICYGNPLLNDPNTEDLERLLKEKGLDSLLNKFDCDLSMKVTNGGDSLSIGQKQLIAFMRAVLKEPEILILDEATANIDTVTEKLLEQILEKLPARTTLIVIAHRLNTIENADEILFVNAGKINKAGSFDQAVKMLLEDKRKS